MSQLTQNAADLDALIAKANALPDAGSGGTVETCTVTITNAWCANNIYATVYDGSVTTNDVITADLPATITISNMVVGGTIIIPLRGSDISDITMSDNTVVIESVSTYGIRIDGDCELTFIADDSNEI